MRVCMQHVWPGTTAESCQDASHTTSRKNCICNVCSELIEDVAVDVIADVAASARALFFRAVDFIQHEGRHQALALTHDFDHLIDAVHDVLVSAETTPAFCTMLQY